MIAAALASMLVFAHAAAGQVSCDFRTGPCPAVTGYDFPPNRIAYHDGGPVQSHPTVYVLLLGRWRPSDPRLIALRRFYRDLPTAGWTAALSVYGVRSAAYAGEWAFPAVRSINNFNRLVRLARQTGERAGVRDWTDAQFVFVPAPGVDISTRDRECAEHDWVPRHVPGGRIFFELLIAPLFTSNSHGQSNCTADYSARHALAGNDPPGALTSAASHEFVETATDPFYPHGWSHHGRNGTVELADLCYWYSSEQPGLGNTTWVWSTARQACYPTADPAVP